MVSRVVVMKGTYRDSITVMKISNELSAASGIRSAAAVMATGLNKRLLGDLGFRAIEVESAGPNDLVVALEAQDENALGDALEKLDRLLSARKTMLSGPAGPRTLDSALGMLPDANLAVISVPGQFAKREALRALREGLHVFLFSSNVPAADELELKRIAKDSGLLLMGPDCGTAMLNGVVLGFGNVVRRGPVGIVSASGTGSQQVSVLVHGAGLGISQVIGTGGSDLSEQIGGLMMIEGLKLLEDDEGTKVIVIISKPPGPPTAEKLLVVARQCRKPVVVNFLGRSIESAADSGVREVATLEDAAKTACALVRGETPRVEPFSAKKEDVLAIVEREASSLTASQKYVRGLFSGGTLCLETMVVMTPLIGGIYSNTALGGSHTLGDANVSREHTCVDLGSEEFTAGRLHPMMDYTLRKMRILREAKDPETAVILADIVLGIGSNPDPAAELVPTVAEAKGLAQRGGRSLPIVASAIGTPDDPQDLTRQRKELENAGVIVMESNAQAARIAALIATRGAAAPRVFGSAAHG